MPHPLVTLSALARLPPVYKLVRQDASLFESVLHLIGKIEMMQVATADVDGHVARYFGEGFTPVEGLPEGKGWKLNPVLRNRLHLAVELIPHTVYSVCEVAAGLLASLDQRFPSTFNKLRKKLTPTAAEPFASLRDALGDLTWYRTAREMRTEWTHYSCTFAGGMKSLILVLYARRRPSDREVFRGRPHQLALDDVKKTAHDAGAAMASLGTYITTTLILPRVDRSETVKNGFRFDANANIVMTSDGRFNLRESATMGEIIAELGLS